MNKSRDAFNKELKKRKAIINLKKCKENEKKKLEKGDKYVKVSKGTFILR